MGLVRYATRDLRRFWSTLDKERPKATRDALLRFTPALTDQYGAMSAALSADWYDEVRGGAAVQGSFRARPAGLVPVEAVESRVRFGAQHLFTLTPEQTLAFLADAATEYVLQPGRDTIATNTTRDPRASGWQRIASANACGFCRMLEGRGGVYKEASADFAAHGNCNCTAAPSWDPDAPEVPARAYEASQTTSGMSDEQREAHNRRIREYIASLD